MKDILVCLGVCVFITAGIVFLALAVVTLMKGLDWEQSNKLIFIFFATIGCGVLVMGTAYALTK